MKKKLNIVYLSIVLTNVLIAILNYSKFKKWFSLFFPILLMLIFILQYAVSKKNKIQSYCILFLLYLTNCIYYLLISNNIYILGFIWLVLFPLNLVFIHKYI
jgi:hypothetical protein